SLRAFPAVASSFTSNCAPHNRSARRSEPIRCSKAEHRASLRTDDVAEILASTIRASFHEIHCANPENHNRLVTPDACNKRGERFSRPEICTHPVPTKGRG